MGEFSDVSHHGGPLVRKGIGGSGSWWWVADYDDVVGLLARGASCTT